MAIAAGKLREPIAVQEKNLVDNGRGGRKRPDGGPEWIDVASAADRAEIIPMRGDEALKLGVERSTQMYRVTIRRRDDLTAANRLLWNGIGLNIRTLIKSVDQRDLVLTCESGVPG